MAEHHIAEPAEQQLTPDQILNFIQTNLIGYSHRLGFRGQRNEDWNLEPTLSRFVKKVREKNRSRDGNNMADVQAVIAQKFKENLLQNQDLTPDQIDRIDIWQYGQHYGLPTPLLDWTYSPYVALYFALLEDNFIVSAPLTTSNNP